MKLRYFVLSVALACPAAGSAMGLLPRDKQNRFAVAKPYQWVDFCGRRMKAGVFELRAGARYWVQVSATPDPVLDLFIAGPLN